MSSPAKLASLVVACAASAQAQIWEKLPSLPEPNGGFACAAWEGKIAVVGGTNWEGDEKRWLTVVHVFDPAEPAWTLLKPLIQPIAHPVISSTSAGLVVVGGTTGQAPFLSSVSVTRGETTARSGPSISRATVGAAGGAIGGEFILVGGTDDIANIAQLRSGAFAWDFRSGKERTLPDYPGGALGLAASVTTEDELFIFGGATWDSAAKQVVNRDDAWAFSVRRNQWRRLHALPAGVRAMSAVRLDTHRFYLAGGFESNGVGFTDHAWIYHIAEDRYVPARALPYRAYVGLVESAGYVYCLGGEDRGKHRTDEVYRAKVADLLK
ncbi:MAG TPA: kelch repeat-containing protein [Opitutaceae bacterium]|nr:kelch repeat-containing protein [Opitutaceae bacterium]